MSFLTQADGTDANVVYGVNASGSGIIGHSLLRQETKPAQPIRAQSAAQRLPGQPPSAR